MSKICALKGGKPDVHRSWRHFDSDIVVSHESSWCPSPFFYWRKIRFHHILQTQFLKWEKQNKNLFLKEKKNNNQKDGSQRVLENEHTKKVMK